MTEQGGLNAIEEALRQSLLGGLAGDAQAYQTFLKALSGHLRAYFRRRLTGLPDEVEDLVQETLLAIHNQRHTYDASQPLTPWVYAIARYKLVDRLRRRAAKERLTDPLEAMDALFSTADSDAAEARCDLEGLLTRLPERQRLPIVLTKLEGRSVAETAAITGLSESAVKVGVHRGLKALAALIRGET